MSSTFSFGKAVCGSDSSPRGVDVFVLALELDSVILKIRSLPSLQPVAMSWYHLPIDGAQETDLIKPWWPSSLAPTTSFPR